MIRTYRDSSGWNHLNFSKVFIEYSNNINDIYKNIEECNPNKKRKTIIAFDDMIADMLSNKKLNSVVTELFNRSKKLNVFLVFITQSYLKVSKDVILNTTHFLLWNLQANKNLKKLLIIIHQILNLRNLLIFIKMYLKTI